ncbi:MAG: hypothetical protein AAB728_02660, partial [Patescibacteria group bacterium]
LGRHAEAAGDETKAQEWYGRTRFDIYPRDLLLSRSILYMEHNAVIDAESVLKKYMGMNNEDARGWKLLGEVQLRQFRAREAVESFRQAYLLARWNDAGIVRGYVQALMDAGRGRELALQGPEILRLMEAYATAIRKNTHFIALSGNVEQFMELSKLAKQVYGDDKGRINGWMRDVEEGAQQARRDFSSRRPGFLW